MDPLILSLVSACTALVASILGPIVTLAVARRQFNANVLPANRQKWIESLRDSLAELNSLLTMAGVLKVTWKQGLQQGTWNKALGPIAANHAPLERLERLVLVKAKIRLLIKPVELDHQELYRAIDTALSRFKSGDLHEADIEAITRLAQTILQQEWQRVKHWVQPRGLPAGAAPA